jgi:toxin ParE1/3/4
MMRVHLSPAAQADLDGIWRYTVHTWGVRQAERYVETIRDTALGLAAGTQISRSAAEIRAGYRKAIAGMHLLFFKIEEDGTINVIRILHQQMDVEQHLRDDN